MSLTQILGIIGIPSLATIIGVLIRLWKNTKIMMEAIQAQMRKELLSDYRKYMKEGFISDEDLIEFEHEYLKYHALGKNGIMDAKYNALIELNNQNK